MEQRPQRKIIIERRGKDCVIFLQRHTLTGIPGFEWKLVEELIRCPKEETEFEARQYAEEQRIRLGITEEIEVRT